MFAGSVDIIITPDHPRALGLHFIGANLPITYIWLDTTTFVQKLYVCEKKSENYFLLQKWTFL
jgi:hypothetical protein